MNIFYILSFCFSLNVYEIDSSKNRLILSRLIHSRQINLAKRMSQVVVPGFEDIESYSGFITVDEKYNSNLFFWLFKSKKVKAPLTVWLQGGPGGSSLIGLFYENGPLHVTKNLTLTRRKCTWTKSMHMLYIDSPVGTGFSFTGSPSGYTTNLEQDTDHLYSFMQQFFTLFPELEKNDFYLTGESYGCKPVASLAYRIHKEEDAKINLKGIAIGGGFCDPATQSKYSQLLYQIAEIDDKQKLKLEEREKKIDELVEAKDYEGASNVWYSLWGIVRYVNPYNFVQHRSDDYSDAYIAIVNETDFRRAIHVGNTPINDVDTVFNYHSSDFMKSVKHLFPTLLNNYKVFLFNGNLDVITGSVLTDRFIDRIEWEKITDYQNVGRKIMVMDNKVVAYTKSFENLMRATVLKAGHLTPHDRPRVNYELIVKFINGNI